MLAYIFAGGSRAAAWANTFQTLVFMAMGLVAFVLIYNVLGQAGSPTNVAARVTEQGTVVQDYSFDKASGNLVKAEKPKVVGKLKHPEEAEEWAGKQPHLTRDEVEIIYKAKNPKTKELVDKTRDVGCLG